MKSGRGDNRVGIRQAGGRGSCSSGEAPPGGVSLWGLSSGWGSSVDGLLVEGAVAERGMQDVDAASRQADQGGVVFFALRCVCGRLEIRQSMGRVGSRFDNAAAESFFTLLGHGRCCPATLPLHQTKHGPLSWTGTRTPCNNRRRHTSTRQHPTPPPTTTPHNRTLHEQRGTPQRRLRCGRQAP